MHFLALLWLVFYCVISYKGKKYVLLLSMEESFEDTFLHIFKNTTHIVTQEVTLRNNLYTSRA